MQGPRARNSEREGRGGSGGDFRPSRIEGARFVFIDESGLNVNMSRGRGYARVSETPGCCVPRRLGIPVLAAMSPELKIVHETHKGGVTAALLPGSSTGSSQSSTGSARRLLLSLCGQCCHPQDIEEGGNRCAQEDWRGASPPLHCPLLPTTQSHRALCARGKSHVLMSLSVLLRDAGHRGCHWGGLQKGGEGAYRGLLQTPGAQCHKLCGWDPPSPAVSPGPQEVGGREESERQGDKSPPEHERHNRVRRGGLLTPGVCKSELPFVQV